MTALHDMGALKVNFEYHDMGDLLYIAKFWTSIRFLCKSFHRSFVLLDLYICYLYFRTHDYVY